jgi:hypothetical protein
MREFMLCLMICLMARSVVSQEISPAAPLNETEKRQVFSQLYELKTCREQASALPDAIAAERKQDEKERANYERALEIEKQATSLAQKERDLEKERAIFYEQSYRALMKGHGIGCRIAKILTLGIARCR